MHRSADEAHFTSCLPRTLAQGSCSTTKMADRLRAAKLQIPLSCCRAARAVQATTPSGLALTRACAAHCGPGRLTSQRLPDRTQQPALHVRAARPASTACMAAADMRVAHSSSSSSSSWYLATQYNSFVSLSSPAPCCPQRRGCDPSSPSMYIATKAKRATAR